MKIAIGPAIGSFGAIEHVIGAPTKSTRAPIELTDASKKKIGATNASIGAPTSAIGSPKRCNGALTSAIGRDEERNRRADRVARRANIEDRSAAPERCPGTRALHRVSANDRVTAFGKICSLCQHLYDFSKILPAGPRLAALRG